MRKIISSMFLLAAASVHAAPPAGQNALAGAQMKVDVGGHKLNLYCTGKGSPTALFEADLGRAGWDWSAVLPAVAQRARACVYDRGGLGASDPILRAATVANASKDLNFLIKNAGLEAPFVLVGAGYGAMVSQHLALRSRNAGATVAATVVGLVLVQPMHEDALPVDRGAQLDTALARQPAYWRARASELDSLDTSANQLRTARKPFGELPVIEVRQAEPAAITAAITQLLDRLKP
ncbi:alpha/beta hydrolase [Duganella sp. FT50W]|uniref:Alpha/beta hydrolase n=1 Tax=Duganella lactea TaxID=2692173 RepID=A0A6L8MK26_9BURK|nr:alpha/beta hydrolase [Duganella lactea]MYM83243.1 alpha/beta hydrolase [Duganella lactea]